MESESLVEELQGYTIDKLKELCSGKGIKFAGRAKDELIALLAGKMSRESTRVFRLTNEDDFINAGATAPDAEGNEDVDITTAGKTGKADPSDRQRVLTDAGGRYGNNLEG